MRHPDWENRLDVYLAEQEFKGWMWGENDYCHFAAGAAEAITGVGYGHLHVCTSALSARKLLNLHGGVVAIADQHYSRIDVSYAQRGDIVAADVSHGELGLGVCIGSSAVLILEAVCCGC